MAIAIPAPMRLLLILTDMLLKWSWPSARRNVGSIASTSSLFLTKAQLTSLRLLLLLLLARSRLHTGGGPGVSQKVPAQDPVDEKHPRLAQRLGNTRTNEQRRYRWFNHSPPLGVETSCMRLPACFPKLPLGPPVARREKQSECFWLVPILLG